MIENKLVHLEAEPKPLEVDLARLAILVIDMQNAFASKGGMFDLWGFDISAVPEVVRVIHQTLAAARKNDIKIIYVAHRLSPDLREVGPLSPFSANNTVVESFHEKPETRDKILLSGTWGAEIIDELKPQSTEIIIEKRRYSAFMGTDLDMILRTYDIKYLAFLGVTTNICVESSLRDAHHREYFPILISDGTSAPKVSMKEATINNVKQVFGWVTTSEMLLNTFVH